MVSLLKYVMLCQREGISRNKSLEIYRAAGGKVRRSVFLRTWQAGLDAADAFPSMLERVASK